MEINIAFGVNEDWLKYVRITITSILIKRSQNDFYNFYILSDADSQDCENIFAKFKNVANIKFHFLQMHNEEFDGCIHDWLGVSASYRLKLSSLIKKDKVLYLDGDTVAIQDIAELYKTDIEEYYIAACEDKSSQIMLWRVGFDDNEKYINSGVLLINLTKWRENNLESLIFQKLKENELYTDQDVINDVCKNNIKFLPIKYNLMPTGKYETSRQQYEEALLSPVILHFTKKPWTTSSEMDHYWHMYKDIYNEL